jgi:hypothetical protein
VVYRECSVARLREFRHEYASAVTRAAGGFFRERLGTSRVAKMEFTNWQFFEPHLIEDRCLRGSKPISQEKPSPRSGESSSRTELRDSREKRPLPMEDITTENQPTSQKVFADQEVGDELYAGRLCRRCVALTVLCVRDRGTEFV